MPPGGYKLKVEKKDGGIVDFDDTKIENALRSAFQSEGVNTEPVVGLTNEVVKIIPERDLDRIHIEEI